MSSSLSSHYKLGCGLISHPILRRRKLRLCQALPRVPQLVSDQMGLEPKSTISNSQSPSPTHTDKHPSIRAEFSSKPLEKDHGRQQHGAHSSLCPASLPLAMAPREMIPSPLTVGLATWLTLNNRTLADRYKEKLERCFEDWACPLHCQVL